MKKVMALMIAMLVLLAGFAGCGGDSSSASGNAASSAISSDAGTGGDSGSDPAPAQAYDPKPFKISMSLPDSGITQLVSMSGSMNRLTELANGTVLYNATTGTPDDQITYVEQQIAAGADGLLICPSTDSILPTVTQLCEEAGVYWGIYCRTILDDEIREMVFASEYYVGNCYENEEDAGYSVMKDLNDLGYEKVAIISMPVGNTTTDRREQGIQQACDEFGMSIVGEARSLAHAADAASATESFLSANPDLDCVFVVGSTVAGIQEAISKAITDAGRSDSVKIATMDWPQNIEALFEEGSLVVACNPNGVVGPFFDAYMVMVKVLNAVQGYPIEGGEPFSNVITYYITNLEQAQKLNSVVMKEDFIYFDDEFVTANLFKWNNPGLTQQTFQDIIDSYDPLT